MTLLKINRLLPIYISIVPLKFEVDIQSQSKVRVWKPKKSNMAARRPFWKWHRWKSIGFCLWPPSTCIWNLKLKFQSKLDLCSGNHVVYRQTDRRTDKVNPVYPPSNCVGRGYKEGISASDGGMDRQPENIMPPAPKGGGIKNIFSFIISQHWDCTAPGNLSLWKTMTCLYCVVNTMVGNGLEIQGATASAVLMLN